MSLTANGMGKDRLDVMVGDHQYADSFLPDAGAGGV
jgi:hypothetical protein